MMDDKLRILYAWMLDEKMTVRVVSKRGNRIEIRWFGDSQWQQSTLSGGKDCVSGIFYDYAVNR